LAERTAIVFGPLQKSNVPFPDTVVHKLAADKVSAPNKSRQLMHLSPLMTHKFHRHPRRKVLCRNLEDHHQQLQWEGGDGRLVTLHFTEGVLLLKQHSLLPDL
jgi:hypothetical protein